MTRKDYEAIADALRTYREDIKTEHADTMTGRHRLDTLEDVVTILSDIFEAENPRFQAGRFWQATR